jgi:putative membrane protein
MRAALLVHQRRQRRIRQETQMRTATLIAAGMLATVSAASFAQEPAGGDRPAGVDRQRTADASNRSMGKLSTPEFVKKAGAAGMAEVEMGKLGSQKASSAEVKAYAKRMVVDHTSANEKLTSTATAKNLEVPSAPDMKHKAMMEKFERQSSDNDFDHDFMQQMVKDHEAAIELYESASSDQNVDPAFQALATKTLPVLRDHLKQAQALESKLDK